MGAVIEATLDVLLGNEEISDETEDVLRNIQQCVHLVRRVFASLMHKNEDEYADVIAKLQCHVGKRKNPDGETP